MHWFLFYFKINMKQNSTMKQSTIYNAILGISFLWLKKFSEVGKRFFSTRDFVLGCKENLLAH